MPFMPFTPEGLGVSARRLVPGGSGRRWGRGGGVTGFYSRRPQGLVFGP